MFTRPVGTPTQQNLGVPLLKANNLSDVENAATARANLGVSSSADSLLKANNLSDLQSKYAALANLKTREVSVILFGATGGGVSDDRASIQLALDSGFTSIFVPAGTFLISSVNPDVSGAGLRIPSNVTLRLAGGATIKRGTNAVTALLINAADGITGGYTASSNIEVCGGTWDGNSGSFASNCTIMAWGHATDIFVHDCTILNTPVWHAIEFNAVLRGTALRVVIDSVPLDEAIQLDTMLQSSVFPWFGPYDNTGVSNIVIEDCTFTNVKTAVGSHTQPAGSNIIIDHCTVTGSTASAIQAHGYNNLVVSRCVFSGCVQVFSSENSASSGVILANNRISGSTSKDIDLTLCSNGIVFGTVITTVATGITNAATSMIVRDNVIDGVRTGGLISGGSTGQVIEAGGTAQSVLLRGSTTGGVIIESPTGTEVLVLRKTAGGNQCYIDPVASNDSSIRFRDSAGAVLATMNRASLGTGFKPAAQIQLVQISDPATPAASAAYFYLRNNAGKGQLVCLFPSGAAQVIANEP